LEIYSILSHKFRRKILLLIEKEGFISYTDLMDKLKIDSTGQLNFHLKKIESLINKDNKTYSLNEDGKRIIKIIDLNKRVLAGEEIDEYLNIQTSEINRIGVTICNCNSEISNALNIETIKSYLKKLDNVVSIKIFDNFCQQKNYNNIIQWIKENYINKIVIAACSPKTHQNLFEKIFKNIIEKPNIEIANIREQCAWVHPFDEKSKNKILATEKAKLLIEASVGKAMLQKKIKIKRVEVEKSCAILGGGIAGMTLALNLAKAGIKVYLIEKSPTLGGKVARWDRIFNMGDCSTCFISELIAELTKEKKIKILTNTEIENISGEVGNFSIDLIKNPRYVDEKKCTGCKLCMEVCSVEKSNQYEFGLTNRKVIYIPFPHSFPYIPTINKEDIKNCLNCRICERACVNKAIDLNQKAENFRIKVGVKVIAIGSDLNSNLNKYNYNPQKNIINSAEFERILSSDGITNGKLLKISDRTPLKIISIIQDIEPFEYENQFRDLLALKYLDSIKIKDPQCQVNIFYNLKRWNRNKSNLLKYSEYPFIYANEIKIISRDNQNIVIADSIEFPSDLVVLNINLVPNKDLKRLRKTMDFSLDDFGFMSKETLASGIYGVGTIFGPLNYQSTINNANNVALQIISVLSHDYLIAEFSGIEIDEDLCGLCGLCVNSCPYNALIIEKGKLNIDRFKCKGCGTCVSVCPTNALEMNIDTSEKILTSIDIFSKSKMSPKIIAFCCNACGYSAADDAGIKRKKYVPNIFIIKVPCSGRIDMSFIIKALEVGFDGIMIIGCSKDACRYINGIQQVERKLELLKRNLGNRFKESIILKHFSGIEGNEFANAVNEFYNKLKVINSEI